MPEITTELEVISQGIFGKDVRKAIHDAINRVNGTVDEHTEDKEDKSNKDVAGGYVGLDNWGKIPKEYLPNIAITDAFVVANENAMLYVNAQKGDVVICTDSRKSYILKGDSPGYIENWQELLSPLVTVASVNGKTGVVLITKGDVGLGNVDNTSDAAKNVLSASKFTTPRKINGKTYDGQADITLTPADIGLPNVNNTADAAKNVLSASKLTTPRTINGIAFDGTGNIVIPSGAAVGMTPHYVIAPAGAAQASSANLVLSGVPSADLAAINNALATLHNARPAGPGGVGKDTSVPIRVDFLPGNVDLGNPGDGVSGIVIPGSNMYLFGNGVHIKGTIAKANEVNKYGVITVNYPDVTLDSFSITNDGGNSALVFLKTPTGLPLNKCSVINCTINSTALYGIYMTPNDECLIANNIITGLKGGIYFEGPASPTNTVNTIFKNTVYCTGVVNGFNCITSYCQNARILYNICSSINGPVTRGIFSDRDKCLIIGNMCYVTDHGVLSNGYFCRIEGNHLTSTAGYGLNLNGGYSTVTGNYLSGQYGMVVNQNGVGSAIIGNVLNSNLGDTGWAFYYLSTLTDSKCALIGNTVYYGKIGVKSAGVTSNSNVNATTSYI